MGLQIWKASHLQTLTPAKTSWEGAYTSDPEILTSTQHTDQTALPMTLCPAAVSSQATRPVAVTKAGLCWGLGGVPSQPWGLCKGQPSRSVLLPPQHRGAQHHTHHHPAGTWLPSIKAPTFISFPAPITAGPFCFPQQHWVMLVPQDSLVPRAQQGNLCHLLDDNVNQGTYQADLGEGRCFRRHWSPLLPRGMRSPFNLGISLQTPHQRWLYI